MHIAYSKAYSSSKLVILTNEAAKQEHAHNLAVATKYNAKSHSTSILFKFCTLQPHVGH